MEKNEPQIYIIAPALVELVEEAIYSCPENTYMPEIIEDRNGTFDGGEASDSYSSSSDSSDNSSSSSSDDY